MANQSNVSVLKIEPERKQDTLNRVNSLGHQDPVMDFRLAEIYNTSVSLWKLSLNLVATKLR